MYRDRSSHFFWGRTNRNSEQVSTSKSCMTCLVAYILCNVCTALWSAQFPCPIKMAINKVFVYYQQDWLCWTLASYRSPSVYGQRFKFRVYFFASDSEIKCIYKTLERFTIYYWLNNDKWRCPFLVQFFLKINSRETINLLIYYDDFIDVHSRWPKKKKVTK